MSSEKNAGTYPPEYGPPQGGPPQGQGNYPTAGNYPPGYVPPPGQGGYPQAGPYPPGNAPPYNQSGYQQPGMYPPGNVPPYGQGQAGYYPQSGQPQTVIMAQPGPPGMVVTTRRPPNYIIPSILACLFCCWPIGLGSIYYAHQANKMADEGDIQAADRASRTARNLIIATVVCGIVIITLSIVLRVILVSTHSPRYY